MSIKRSGSGVVGLDSKNSERVRVNCFAVNDDGQVFLGKKVKRYSLHNTRGN